MTNHLPECSAATIEDLLDGFPDMHPSNRVYLEGEVCICDALRACEQRSRDAERRALFDEEGPYTAGFNTGVQSARDAVAALLGKTVPPSEGITDALAAIDALVKGSENNE